MHTNLRTNKSRAPHRAYALSPLGHFTLESIKQIMINTPFERPMLTLRHLAGYRSRRRHPELREIHLEHQRTEQVLSSFLKPTSNCLDVGCHIGAFLSLLLRISPHGRHMAFEALPEKASRLRMKFADVEIAGCAVGEKSGHTKFFRNVTQSGFSGMNVHGSSLDEHEQLDVCCRTLDELVPTNRQIDFIKIDVEGGELSVLKGARCLIARSRPVVLFECTASGLDSSGTEPEQIFQYVTSEMKYEIFLLKDWLNKAEPLSMSSFKESMKYPFKAFNFLAAPRIDR